MHDQRNHTDDTVGRKPETDKTGPGGLVNYIDSIGAARRHNAHKISKHTSLLDKMSEEYHIWISNGENTDHI